VIVNSQGQFNDIVTLALSGLPSGTTVNFNPASGKPPFTSALTISAAQSAPAGTYTATIDASGGGKSQSEKVIITIESAAVSASSFLDSLLANPLNLLLIIIVILLAVLILKSTRRGTKATSQRPETHTGTS
jgi:hypothetical protein